MGQNHLKIYKGTTYAPQAAEPANPTDGDIYYDSTLNKFRAYQNGSWADLITDGADGINYILNPGAESGVDGYLSYADAAGTSPVDGTGGSPSFVSWTRTTTASEILRKDASFKFTKSSGNAQGEGEGYNFSIHPRDKNNKLQISFDYKNLDANYVNGDVQIYVYDVDNSELIGNAVNDDDGVLFISPADGGTFYGEIQATNSLNYRLIFHIAGTTSANWALSVDSIKVGPTSSQLFSIMSDWTSFTPSGSWTTNTLYTGRYRRVGDSVEVNVVLQLTGAPDNVGLNISMPAGLVADTAKLALSTVANIIGNVKYDDNSLGAAQGLVVLTSPTTVQPQLERIVGNNDVVAPTQTLPHTWAVNDSIAVNFKVPVVGWHSTNLVSNNQLNQQTILSLYRLSANQVISSSADTKVDWDVIDHDTHSTLSNGSFIAPKDGYYNVKALVIISGTTDQETYSLFIRVNTVFAARDFKKASSTLMSLSLNKTVYLNKGDEVDITIDSTIDTSYTVIGTNIDSVFEVNSVPDFTSYGVLNPKTEYLEAEVVSPVSTVSADTYVDSGAEIELTPGTWDLGYTGSLAIQNVSSGGLVYGEVLIRDGAGTSISDTRSLIALTVGVTSGVGFYATGVSAKKEITITTTTTFKLSHRCSVANTLDTVFLISGNQTGGLSGNDNTSKIWARRIK